MFALFGKSRKKPPVSFVPNLEASAVERERMRLAESELKAIARDIALIQIDKPVQPQRRP
jgi:hypothetical protein